MKIIKTFNFKNKVDYYDLPPERVSRSRVTKRYQLNLLKRCLKAKKNADYLVLFLDFYIVKPLRKQFNWNLFRQNNIMIRSSVFFNGGGSISITDGRWRGERREAGGLLLLEVRESPGGVHGRDSRSGSFGGLCATDRPSLSVSYDEQVSTPSTEIRNKK